VDETVVNEPVLLEKFKAAIPVKVAEVADREKIIAEYDKIWLPKAPILADLRKAGASL
jgi:hypothetical protein